MLATSVREGLGGLAGYMTNGLDLNLGISLAQIFHLQQDQQTAFTQTNLPIFSLISMSIISGFSGGFGALALSLQSIGLDFATDFISEGILSGFTVPSLDHSAVYLVYSLQQAIIRDKVLQSYSDFLSTSISQFPSFTSQDGGPTSMPQYDYNPSGTIGLDSNPLQTMSMMTAALITLPSFAQYSEMIIENQRSFQKLSELKQSTEDFEQNIQEETSRDNIYHLEDVRTGKITSIAVGDKWTLSNIYPILRRKGALTTFKADPKAVFENIEIDPDAPLGDLVGSENTIYLWPTAAATAGIVNDMIPIPSWLFEQDEGYYKVRDDLSRSFEGNLNVEDGFNTPDGRLVLSQFYKKVVVFLRNNMNNIFLTSPRADLKSLLLSEFNLKLKSQAVENALSGASKKQKALFYSQIETYFKDTYLAEIDKMANEDLQIFINDRLDETILNYLMKGPMDTSRLDTNQLLDSFNDFLLTFDSRFLEFQSVTYDLFHSSRGPKLFAQNFMQSFFGISNTNKPSHNRRAEAFIGEIAETLTFEDISIVAMAKAYKKSGFNTIAGNRIADIFASINFAINGRKYDKDFRNVIAEYIGDYDLSSLKIIDDNGIDSSILNTPDSVNFFDVLVAVFESYIVSFEVKNIRTYADIHYIHNLAWTI